MPESNTGAFYRLLDELGENAAATEVLGELRAMELDNEALDEIVRESFLRGLDNFLGAVTEFF